MHNLLALKNSLALCGVHPSLLKCSTVAQHAQYDPKSSYNGCFLFICCTMVKRLEDFPSVQVAAGDSKDSPWYKSDIGPRLKPEVRSFYEEYTGKSGDALIEHLYAVVSLCGSPPHPVSE